MENNKKISVSQKAILYRDDGRFLTIRRTKTAPSRPLHWDLPGGDLEFGEDLREGMIREIKEETGLEVDDLKIIDAISGFNDRNEFWVTICYTAQPKSFEVELSFEHDDLRWVTPEEFQVLDASPKNKKFVENFEYLKQLK
jgi:8-oxo-dGTP diphosphatase